MRLGRKTGVLVTLGEKRKFPQYRDLHKQAEEFRLHLIHLKKSLLLSLKYRGT